MAFGCHPDILTHRPKAFERHPDALTIAASTALLAIEPQSHAA